SCPGNRQMLTLTSCVGAILPTSIHNCRKAMAFGFLKKRVPEPETPAQQPAEPEPVPAAAPASDRDSVGEILELLELELGGTIRKLERAAHSVAHGAEATAATLATIRERTDALSGRSSQAQGTASTFALTAEKFTQSAQASVARCA